MAATPTMVHLDTEKVAKVTKAGVIDPTLKLREMEKPSVISLLGT